MAIDITRRAFTVAEYSQMRAVGILHEDDRVELLDGVIRAISPIEPLHAAIVKRLNQLLAQMLGATYLVSVQDPIRLNDRSEPQPDLALLRARADFYAADHPTAADVLLVIEVSDTSVAYDRDEKLPRYAEAGIAEVWLVDVGALTLEQYTQPRGDKYLIKRIAEQSDTVTAEAVPGLAIAVDRMFG